MTSTAPPETTEKLSPSKAAARRVGTDLTPKWRIDKVLGVGGMGAVFACTQKNNGSRAAIKVLHAEFARTPDVRDRFLREGKIANRVNHAARVAVSDDGMSDLGEPFLVMELLEGMTLSELFKRGGGKMPLDKLLGVFDVVLELLGKCHDVAIVHRDIKPANIFLTSQGDVKVLDFGVARMREPDAGVEATRVGLAMGTASFIAPEQALGSDAIDGRADLFSVGACLFLGVTGKRLHASKTEAEEFILAATQAAPSVARLAPDLPAEVVALIDRSLAYEREQRFPNAAQMRTELLKLLGAMRAGKLEAGRKSATGVTTRGGDGIEVNAGLSETELREQRERLVSIFRQLSVVLASIRQYGLYHPQTTRALSTGFAEIGAALARDATSVRWQVSSGDFVFEGQPIWTPDRVPFDRIPHQLFADGVRKIQIKAGITEDELRDFLVILLRDGSSLFGEEDDAITALWDRRFEHVAYFAVDSFAGGDEVAGHQMAEWEELVRRMQQGSGIDKDFDASTLEAQALELNLLQRLEDAGQAAANLALDAGTRATLGMQLALPAERTTEAFMDVFVSAFADARARGDDDLLAAALRDWTTDQVQLQAAPRVFEVQELLSKAARAQLSPAEAKALEAEAARCLFPLDVLRALMSDLASGRMAEADTVRGAELQRSVAAGLARALELLGNDAVFGLACESLDSSCPDVLRVVLEAYVKRWITKQEALALSWVGRARPGLGRFLLDLVVSMKLPFAAAALDAALANTNLEVRLAALAHMGENVGDRGREVLTALLATDDAGVRLRALDLVASMGVVAAGPWLARRVQSDEFHELAVDERRKILATIARLKPARAEVLAIELLAKWKLLGGDALDQSRAVAADQLGEFDTIEAKDALAAAAKSRWGGSALVRGAATRALAAMEARRSGEARRESSPGEAKST
jgi:predicted Ser/Thr protein kinase